MSTHTRTFLRAAGILTLSVALTGCISSGSSQSTSKTATPRGIELYSQAVAANQAGDRERAISLLKQATTANPDLRMAQTMLADLLRQKGDYQQAVTYYEKLAKMDPFSVTAQYNLGVIYQFLNRLQDSAASYLRALDLNPRDLKSNMNLGLVYLALGQRDDAVKYLQKATFIDPKSALAWVNLGVVLDARGEHVRAEAAYRKSLELDSTSVTTLQNLGSNLITQNKSAEAIEIMKLAVARSDTAPVRKRYGDALVVGKQFESALTQYDLALKKDPRYFPAMNEKAAVLIKQYKQGMELDDEKLKGAVALWKSSLTLNPRQPKVDASVREWENPRAFGQ